jgi:hypothetical protein
MKKSRVIFYSIFAAYHLVVLLFTLYIKTKQQDLVSLYSLLNLISLFVYGALLGLVLVVTDFIWTWKTTRNNEENEDVLILENNTLKAKIYDLQEKSKQAELVPPGK